MEQLVFKREEKNSYYGEREKKKTYGGFHYEYN